tara:strand:+ start:40 stop:435 length:396 start_codon:yes stop_codon:yes gene_type:complete
MRICVSGTFGVTSLVNRLVFNTFSLHHKPTILVTKYRTNGFEVVDLPPDASPINCDLLILTCKAQEDIKALARKWFGFHHHLIIAFFGDAPEEPKLVPAAHFIKADNMSAEGIEEILKIIRLYKYKTPASK